MKVSTKIIVGYAALVLLMVGGIGYELISIQQMQRINRRLSEVNLEAASGVLRLDEYLRSAADFGSRFLQIGGDPYPARIADVRRLFEEELGDLDALLSSPDERAAFAGLESAWEDFVESVAAADAARPDSGFYDVLPPGFDSALEQLQSQLEELSGAIEATKEAEVGLSIETSREAQRVSWMVAIAAVVLAAGVGFSVVRSISGAFKRFMGATRSIAEGRFDQRLPEHRSEFGELARSFNLMARRLEDLDRLKNDFVSSVSHELKSPIASSREIVQLLLDEIPGPLNQEQRRLLELSVRSSRRLSSMVGGLLDLARMDAGTMSYEMEHRDLTELVRQTLEEFEVALEDRGLGIESDLDSEAMVYCDGDRVVQVLGNLIDNAMKFSTRGSTIAVRLEHTAMEAGAPGEVVVSVIDSGPGVPDREKKRIFGKFQQGPQGRSKYKGVGLGLAICWSIVAAHSGRIWVEDNPAGGAIFRFKLPSSPVGAGPSERASAVEV